MGVGPAQLLIVFAFNHSDFYGDINAELKRVRDEDTLRVIDALAVYKHADGEIELHQLRDPRTDEAADAKRTIGALTGLWVKGEAGAVMAPDRAEVFSDETSWDVLDEIPPDSAAALVLVQHHWAVCLRDAIARVGWFRLSDGFIVSPLDLDGIRLVPAGPSQPCDQTRTPTCL